MTTLEIDSRISSISFMSLAKEFGFSVPYNAIIQDGREFHYIIRRYDRFRGAKIDHYEFLTLMDKTSSEKYKVTLKELLDAVMEEMKVEDRTELFRFLVFWVIISHGDLHAKNLSLINQSNHPGEHRLQLAPFYDVSTTAIYKGFDFKDIGLKFGNKQKNIRMENFEWLAGEMGVERAFARSIVESMARRFIEAFPGFVNRLPEAVLSLPIKVSRQGYMTTFGASMKQYHLKRKTYLERFVLPEPEEKEDFWA